MFDDTLLDDQAALSKVDDALRSVAGWGAQVRLADLSAAPALASVTETDRPRAVVAAGADGRLFRAVLEPVCPVPFVAWPHSGLPGWAGPLDLVVVHSPTGSDSEALGVAAEAIRRGASLLVTCPATSPLGEAVVGRAHLLPAGSTDALAMAVPVLAALHKLGLGPEVPAEAVASALDAVALACGPARPRDENPAKELAMVLGDALPVVWGGSVLAARAARRVAEQLRAASGRPALAGAEGQLVPLLQSADMPDLFADPVDDEAGHRPALVILDDGSDTALLRESRTRLMAAAASRRVRIHTVSASGGPDVGRFASLQATGRYAAAYLAVGLGRTAGD